MEQFKQAILTFGDFTPAQIDLITSKVKTIELPANSILLKEGQVCDSIYFVSRGSLRHYRINDEGIEDTLDLFTEGDWLLDYESFTGQKPAKGSIQAFEDCELIELGVWELHALINHSPIFFKIGRILQTGVQKFSLHTSPEQNYLDLLAKRPALFQRFPLHFIASYLGIKPETLSRIRKRISMQLK